LLRVITVNNFKTTAGLAARMRDRSANEVNQIGIIRRGRGVPVDYSFVRALQSRSTGEPVTP
jgi:hypothetical protein